MVIKSKDIFEQHKKVCKYMRKSSEEQQIGNYYSDTKIHPSYEAMAQYIFHLTKKYEDLEQKFTKLQQSVITTRRKSIQEYLDELSEPTETFKKWAKSIEVTDKVVESFTNSCDIKHTIQLQLESSLFDANDDKPLLAFSQRQNTLFLYEDTKKDNTKEWRSMTSEEFQNFIEKLRRKISIKFSIYMKEHDISNYQDEDKMARYVANLNSIKSNSISELKKWLYSKIAVSLKQYVV
jgi:hypothetical protein